MALHAAGDGGLAARLLRRGHQHHVRPRVLRRVLQPAPALDRLDAGQPGRAAVELAGGGPDERLGLDHLCAVPGTTDPPYMLAL